MGAEDGWMRGVALLSAAIFFADASQSLTIPLFPPYARDLGVSLSLLGLIASSTSVSMIILSIPMGRLSDRLGRRKVMALGFICFAIASFSYTLATDPIHLVVGRLILGIGMVSTFSIGFIFTSEMASTRLRGRAQGIYMTAMGTGFTLGPILGGLGAKKWGYHTSFYLSSALALAGLTLVLSLRGPHYAGTAEPSPRVGEASFRGLLKDGRILVAGVSNFINSMMFTTLMTFYPIYGQELGYDEAQVGLGFMFRGLASTLVRLPTGMATTVYGSLRLMIVGLSSSALTVIGLPLFDGITPITTLMGLQGAAYGVYFMSGNAFVTESVPQEMRGTAISAYSTFSNISGVVSPTILGTIAEVYGIKGAFLTSGSISLVGTAVMLFLIRRNGK